MNAASADLALLPTVSVVIAAYTMDRWDDTREAIASAQAQTIPVLETILVVDHNQALLDRARDGIPGITVIPNAGARGASAARNTGVAVSNGEVVAFLDDDAVASPHWLENLLRHFTAPEVVGAGGGVHPIWTTAVPRWFPPEFYWAIGASYQGMPESAAPVRNVWSGNMAIRRKIFDAIDGFRDGFGKVGNRPCPEDTDLCLRAAAAQPGGMWIYDPDGLCGHRVPAQRATVGYFVSRCFNEGWGKAALAALNGVGDSTVTERQYTRRVLPQGISRGLRETARGDVSGGSRSLAITAGVSLAAAGFAAGRATSLAKTAQRARRARRARPEGATSGAHSR
jgi:glycosyltransferase involved in cell wall biosynthesis